MEALRDNAVKTYESKFGGHPSHAAFSPGRVNLIGEHTDYNEGFVFPMALEFGTVVVGSAASGTGRICRVFSVTMKQLLELDLAHTLEPSAVSWHNYILGPISEFMQRVPGLPSFDIVVDSNMPLGGGLSSSASLLVSLSTFLEALSGITLSLKDKALLCQAAEHKFPKVPCGIMDQFASALGRKDHALLIDCRSREATPVPLNSKTVYLLITNTNVSHSLGSSEYPTRVAQCRAAVEAIRRSVGVSVTALRDVSLSQLEQAQSAMDAVVYKRARHVVAEDARTQSAVAALRAGDYHLMGRLMFESHASLRDDYEVSCAELDVLVEAARELEGVYGCRMTGGGFGGCVVSLVKAGCERQVSEALSAVYKEKTGRACTHVFSSAGAGCTLIPVSGAIDLQ